MSINMNMNESFKKTIIAGPCALESKAQLVNCIENLKPLGVNIIRASLWKPRTAPGWEGLGFYGLPLLLEETLSRGLIPATEIMTAIQAQMCIDALKFFGDNARMIVWLGARNQNHFELRRLAHILREGPPSLILIFKNQIWIDKKHWFGLYQHILQSGFPQNRLIACHRGFNPGYGDNPRLLRNIPEYEMSMEMKENMGIPMFLDPSHIAGSRDKVFTIVEESLNYDYDGYLIEVHDNVSLAKTDINQQLTFEQLGRLLDIIRTKEKSEMKDKLAA